MKRQAQTLLAITAFAIPLAFAGQAYAWHINSSCSNSQWIVGIPNESWATGTTATLDFNQGPDATLGKGQAVTAPAAATGVVVTFNNSGERLSATRPAGCVVVVQAIPTTTTVAPTTTLAPTTTVGSSSTLVAFDAELTPVVQPPVVAVDVPPVPQPQGVSAAGSGQTLPQTGGGSSLLLAGGIAVAAGAVAMLVARRRVV